MFYYIQTNDPAIVVRYSNTHPVKVLSIADDDTGPLIPPAYEFNLVCPLARPSRWLVIRALKAYGPGPVEDKIKADFKKPVAVRFGKVK